MKAQQRWKPGCEVSNVGLGDTKLYDVSFHLTKEQYASLLDAITEWRAHCIQFNRAAGIQLYDMLDAAKQDVIPDIPEFTL